MLSSKQGPFGEEPCDSGKQFLPLTWILDNEFPKPVIKPPQPEPVDTEQPYSMKN